MSRKVGIIVEGPSDGVAIEELLRRLGLRPLVRVAGGSRILTDASWMTSRLYMDGAERVIALKDSHCRTDIEAYKKEVLEKIGKVQGLTVCTVVHALESRFLADEVALPDYLRSPVPAQANPEMECAPDERLNHLFHLHNRTYLKRTDAPKLATLIDI